MISKMTKFLQQLAQPSQPHDTDNNTLNLACAVLLVEVMRADGLNSQSEQTAISKMLERHFGLTNPEALELLELAQNHAEHATDFYQYTKLINQQFIIADKINIVTMLWRVALADGEISAIEQHTIRKIADLLYLRHNEYIQSKLAINNSD